MRTIRMTLRGSLGRMLSPRLGRLSHHPPKDLTVPVAYSLTPVPDPAPRISLVTPTLNQAAFLEHTLRSVLEQGYPGLEYIVQDGGSQDGSVDILTHYGRSLAHWESTPDGGQAQAINFGFGHATGEIMAWLNSDDLLLPGALNYVGDFFNRHPDVDVVYGHRILIDEAGGEIGRWILPPHSDEVLRWADYVPQETLFWRRRVWERIGGALDEDYRFAMDWSLLVRFLNIGAKFVRLPRFLGAFRVWQGHKTGALGDSVGCREMGLIRQHCHGRSISQAEVDFHVTGYLARHVVCHLLYDMGFVQY